MAARHNDTETTHRSLASGGPGQVEAGRMRAFARSRSASLPIDCAAMTTERSIVLIVDDDVRVRHALASLLASVGLDVATFASAAEFLAADKPDAPACLVLDLELPDIHGLELQKELAEREAPPIVFITGHGDVPMSVKAMKAGAIEFLSKPFGDKELMEAIDAAITLDRTLRQQRSERAELQRRYERLTAREREVLTFVVAGYANKVTAAELGTSEITIGVHRGQVMRKIGARSLAELVRLTDKLGVRPHDEPSK
jgi:FixJ family two-component response regulator